MLLLITNRITAQSNKRIAVIAYYTGDDKLIIQFGYFIIGINPVKNNKLIDYVSVYQK